MNSTAVSVRDISVESYLIFLFVFVLTVMAGSFIYSAARVMLERKLSQRNAKFLARIIQYVIFAIG
ncbi:MAG: hypothetical protein K8I00_09265, partial [Candidatus Omnitrophica bacterium]|nr:hypothetical protein [Candidatus Omnitrophota bacterium]